MLQHSLIFYATVTNSEICQSIAVKVYCDNANMLMCRKSSIYSVSTLTLIDWLEINTTAE